MRQESLNEFHSLGEYVSSPVFGIRDDTSLHVGLLPMPYVGNLQDATVYILMLNPGLAPGDYFAEYEVRQFREAHIRNLRQEFTAGDSPFLFLDPRFAWHPGFTYWHSKFASIAQALAARKRITHAEALKHIAGCVASLELIPYHSKNFGAGPLLKHLPSARMMRNYVHEVLVPRAESNEITVIATRGVRNWGLTPSANILLYEGSETRSAHLTLGSRGGKRIAERLGL